MAVFKHNLLNIEIMFACDMLLWLYKRRHTVTETYYISKVDSDEKRIKRPSTAEREFMFVHTCMSLLYLTAWA